jgi:hypothetical protein
VLHLRCPQCQTPYPYPQDRCPKGTEAMQGRYVCHTCGGPADFGRYTGTGTDLRCNTCLAAETARVLHKQPTASTPAQVRGMGLVALAIGLPFAALTAWLVVIESGWFVLTGVVALGVLALSGNYLLRTKTVAAESVVAARRTAELLPAFEDQSLAPVEKLKLVGMYPGTLWPGTFPADAVTRSMAQAR